MPPWTKQNWRECPLGVQDKLIRFLVAKVNVARWCPMFLNTISHVICYEPAETCVSAETVLVRGGAWRVWLWLKCLNSYEVDGHEIWYRFHVPIGIWVVLTMVISWLFFETPWSGLNISPTIYGECMIIVEPEWSTWLTLLAWHRCGRTGLVSLLPCRHCYWAYCIASQSQ